jgi:mutual gliding-motility protein MglA
MVFFNYATMQMAAKIVYYGPGLCGKTTNLHWIYAKTSPQSRGEMVSLETETDRTLFFDLLPIDVGVIGGFKTRLQLYTIPGQVFYNTTRKLVLKGVDGVVFVADSQRAMLEANVESFKNLRENLSEIGLDLDDIPLVLQLNKRDLPNVVDKDALVDALDPERKYETTESCAVSGVGVFETLKQISKLTLRTLRRRMTGEEPATRMTVRRADTGPVPAQGSSEPRGNVPSGKFKAAGPPPPLPASSTTSPRAVASNQTGTAVETEPLEPLVDISEEIAESAETFDEALSRNADVDSGILTKAPVSRDEAPAPRAPEPPPAPPPAPPKEPEVDFVQTEKPARSEPQVKHVKVRSSVDIMAELEALRKRATTQMPRVKKDSTAPLPAIPATPSRREMQKTVNLGVANDVLAKTRRVRVAVSFEDEYQGVIHKEEQVVEVADTSDVQTLQVNLKVNVSQS